MPNLDRRDLLKALCLVRESEIHTESVDTPFYEHFHTLAIPVSALISPPQEGITVTTSVVDQGSYDVSGFKKFIASSGLKADSLQSHSHPVKITQDQLQRIANGEKDVEIRVISKAGNYVHNFLVTAPRSAIVKVQKGRK
jgi:hypothetical protein